MNLHRQETQKTIDAIHNYLSPEISVPGLIEETRALWNQGKKVMIQIAWNLNQIQKSDAWQEYETFPKFCEAELDIRQSTTSKLLTIASYYLKELSPEQIGAVDYELLYASTMLPGTVEENLAKAQTLTRRELREELNESEPHEHLPITICKHCQIRL